MGRKLGFTSLFFRTRDTKSFSSSSPSPWPWPSCKQPKTHSFRAAAKDKVDKIANSAYLDSTESCLTNSLVTESESFSAASECSVEAIIRGLSSDRLFFDPVGDEYGSTSSSIIEEVVKGGCCSEEVPFEGSVAVAVESEDPYTDFRVSMEEMVVAHGSVKDWVWLEEMLGWFLRVNGKRTHGFIIGAFVDLLLGIASSSSLCSSFSISSSSTSYLSTFSNFEIEEEEGNG